MDSAAEFWDNSCWCHGWRSVLASLSALQLAKDRAGVNHALGESTQIEGRIVATVCTATRRWGEPASPAVSGPIRHGRIGVTPVVGAEALSYRSFRKYNADSL
jgi:hypothetical protein